MLVWFENVLTQLSLFVILGLEKLLLGNTGNQEQLQLCSLSSFIHHYELINIVVACLIWKRFNAIYTPELKSAFCDPCGPSNQ